jgi:hypothetical protein
MARESRGPCAPLAARGCAARVIERLDCLSRGAFTQPTDATLTDLNTQSLPFPLPVGWSPLAQFHLGAVSEPALPA